MLLKKSNYTKVPSIAEMSIRKSERILGKKTPTTSAVIPNKTKIKMWNIKPELKPSKTRNNSSRRRFSILRTGKKANTVIQYTRDLNEFCSYLGNRWSMQPYNNVRQRVLEFFCFVVFALRSSDSWELCWKSITNFWVISRIWKDYIVL